MAYRRLYNRYCARTQEVNWGPEMVNSESIQHPKFSCPTALVRVLIFLIAIGVIEGSIQVYAGQEHSGLERVVPYVPTPLDVAEKMLRLAGVSRTDRVYDLGSGDGRIVILAAQKFGAEALGVELDGELYKQSSARIAELGLEKRARILHENMFEINLRPATVVSLYLLTIVNERLRPILEKQLRSGARVVSHDFQVPGWTPDRVEEAVSENGISHKLYLYIRP